MGGRDGRFQDLRLGGEKSLRRAERPTRETGDIAFNNWLWEISTKLRPERLPAGRVENTG